MEQGFIHLYTGDGKGKTTAALGLLEPEEVLDAIASKPGGLELVCTGRGAPAGLIAAADLVTEMVNVKHYYNEGIMARDGIER